MGQRTAQDGPGPGVGAGPSDPGWVPELPDDLVKREGGREGRGSPWPPVTPTGSLASPGLAQGYHSFFQTTISNRFNNDAQRMEKQE